MNTSSAGKLSVDCC